MRLAILIFAFGLVLGIAGTTLTLDLNNPNRLKKVVIEESVDLRDDALMVCGFRASDRNLICTTFNEFISWENR